MSNKFSCPVSMRVTQEQYEKDLKQELLDLGYVAHHVTAGEPLNLLVTNWGDCNGVVYCVTPNSKRSNGRYFINHYNPELFLALAGMREGAEPYPGEYFKVISDEMELYHLKKNHLYKVKYTDRSHNLTYGYLNKNYRKHLYRKATKEDIVNWFTEPETVGDIKSSFDYPLKPQESYITNRLQKLLDVHEKILNSLPQQDFDFIIENLENYRFGITQEPENLPDIKVEGKEIPEHYSNRPLTPQECHKFKDECHGYTTEAWEAAKSKYLEDSKNWVIANGLNTPYETTGYVDPYKAEGTSLEDVHMFSKGLGSSSMTFGSSEGFKDSKEKLNYELDWDFIEAMAKRMSFNKSKYQPYNWMKPLDPEQLKQSLFRHVIEIMKGNYDEDNMENAHLFSIALNSMMINYQLKHNNKTNE